jgi:hypothetical protein
MGAEELIMLDRIECGIRELNRTMREFMRLFEERTRGGTETVKREKRERGQGHGRTK